MIAIMGNAGFPPGNPDSMEHVMKRLSVFLCTMIASSFTQGAVIDVPGAHESITEAITSSSDGDVILVGPGTWAESLDFRGKAITVKSSAGAQVTLITGIPNRSCVSFLNGETQDAVLEGFTITGGDGMPYLGSIVGGGIYMIGGSNPVIRDCVIRDNEAQFGGGVHIALSSPTFEQCIFSDNTSMSNGGAVRIHDNSFPTFVECTFLNNHTNDFGGAIAYGNDSTGIHDNCIFDGNTADIRGGAIYLGCSCSDAQVATSDFCNSIPDHIVGAWSDNGGNSWCPVCEDDINADGIVNIEDLLAVISRWGPCVCIEDINGDANVDVTDLLLVIQDWGTCSG